MKLYIATDHAGVEIKPQVIAMVQEAGHEITDLGPTDNSRVDYTDFAHKLCKQVLEDKGSYGILICGTGIGMSLSANKHKGIRAALCHDHYTAKMARLHNDANVLCFGARIVGLGVVESILEAWLETEFEGGRHERRVKKIDI